MPNLATDYDFYTALFALLPMMILVARSWDTGKAAGKKHE